MNPAGTKVPRACWNVPGNSVSGCSATLPRCSSTSARPASTGCPDQDSASINYEIENTDSLRARSPRTPDARLCRALIDLAANTSGCDDAESDLGSIQMVVFNITILDTNGRPVSTTTSKIGSQVDDQVLLGNSLATSATCGTAVVGSPAQPRRSFPCTTRACPSTTWGTTRSPVGNVSGWSSTGHQGHCLVIRPGFMYFPTARAQDDLCVLAGIRLGLREFGDIRGVVLATDGIVQPDIRVRCAIVSDGDGSRQAGTAESNWRSNRAGPASSSPPTG